MVVDELEIRRTRHRPRNRMPAAIVTDAECAAVRRDANGRRVAELVFGDSETRACMTLCARDALPGKSAPLRRALMTA